MTVIVNGFCALCVLAIAGLLLWAGAKVTQWGIEEAQREELRRQTAAAMRTDKHLAKLRRQKMRVQYYRRARVW